jgi:hypothetical protein
MKMAELPQFLVVGASRSGTTSLHEYLRQHPNISLPLRKETHFFVCDKESIPSPRVYLGRVLDEYIDNLNGYLNEFENKPSATTFGEICPSYLTYPNAAQNIKKYVPDVKILCIVRDPVDRFYSAFNYHNNRSENPIPDGDIGSRIRAKIDPNIMRLYDGGLYFNHLSRYYDLFPHQNIKIYLFDNLRENPQKMLNEALASIGLPPYSFDLTMSFNRSGSLRFNKVYRLLRGKRISNIARIVLPAGIYRNLRSSIEKTTIKKSDPVGTKQRKELQDLYRSDILALENLIDRDLSNWLA